MTRVINMAEERAKRACPTVIETAWQRDQVRADLLDDLSYLDNFGQQPALDDILDEFDPFEGDAA